MKHLKTLEKQILDGINNLNTIENKKAMQMMVLEILDGTKDLVDILQNFCLPDMVTTELVIEQMIASHRSGTGCFSLKEDLKEFFHNPKNVILEEENNDIIIVNHNSEPTVITEKQKEEFLDWTRFNSKMKIPFIHCWKPELL